MTSYEFEPDSIRTSDSQDSGGDVRCALRLPLNAAPLGLPYGLARVVYLDASRCVMRPPSSVGRRCGGREAACLWCFDVLEASRVE